MTNFANEITRFKEWAKSHEGTNGEWECDYPHWAQLYAAAEEAISSSTKIPPNIETSFNLIYAIARDNESERLRERLIEYPKLLRLLALLGINSIEPDAKWQIAVSVADARLPDSADLIRPYLADDDEYVRRRSLLAIAAFSPAEAEEIAKSWMNEDYEYSRIAGINVLNIIKSDSLSFYLERHAKDPSEYVRLNIAEIKKQNMDDVS
ncbi:MAG: HEAT repeat domain-containing protein [Kangiella sp.]|nr:HEAT repeat domain-containing protein [Kangiella sp.]